ncbi:hypothetical protein [Fluviicola sp.]|uniref:hypothetical protein n=1 Tax=Fluviicola sp. TaxID=1917219 RepID=UPI0031E3DBC1
MSKHQFKISISGTEKEATEKALGLAVLASQLDAKTITALARIVQTDPAKVALAKSFLGIQ